MVMNKEVRNGTDEYNSKQGLDGSGLLWVRRYNWGKKNERMYWLGLWLKAEQQL